MVAGISGATPGSGATVGLEDDPKLKPVVSQPPRKIVSAETIAKLAAGRALRDLFMASPEQTPGRSRPAANRKTPTGAMMLRHWTGFGCVSTSYIGLTKALTPLLDRTAAKPYFPIHISTQIPRLLMLLPIVLLPAVSNGPHST